MRYGALEFAYAELFADALVTDRAFRSWVLKQTCFSRFADEALPLHDEMLARRGKNVTTWWRSHYSEKCRCEGCSGQETDILAIFEAADERRFALHVEVKQPTDRFPPLKDQAANYGLRAKCWAASAPRAVLPHSDATTMLLCSRSKLREYASHIPRFGSVITFEDIRTIFPGATLPIGDAQSGRTPYQA
jgi:hypothetical protein